MNRYGMEESRTRGNTSCGYLGTIAGVCKLLTIILGAVSIAVGSYAHFESFYIWQIKEEALLASTACCFAISLFYFFAYLASSKLQSSNVNRTIDFIFHILAGILLVITGSLVIESTVEIDKKICRFYPLWPFSVPCQLYTEKLIASIIAVVNGLLYGMSALLVIACQ